MAESNLKSQWLWLWLWWTGTFLLLVGVCVVTFENSLPNDWAFDDHLAIVNNPDTNPATPFSDILKNDIWGKDLRAIDSHRSIRPLLILLFKVFRMRYGLDATALRRYSILLHVVATLGVRQLAARVLGDPLLALGAALFFASHPVHVEAVAAVVNIAEACSLICYIAAYFVFDSQQYLEPARYHGLFAMFRDLMTGPLLWLTCAFTAILFKESALSICGIVIGKLIIESIHRFSTKATGSLIYRVGTSALVWRNLMWTTMAFLTIALYSLFRNVLIHGFNFENGLGLSSVYLSDSQLIRNAENPFAFLHGKEKAMSLMYLHFRYFWVMLWPDKLSAEYSFDCISKIANPSDLRFAATCGLYVVLLGFGLWGIYCLAQRQSDGAAEAQPGHSTTALNDDGAPHASRLTTTTDISTSITDNKDCALLGSLMWLIVPFVPASGVFLRLGTLLAERLLYIPSVGYCMLLSMAVYRITSLLVPFGGTGFAALRRAIYWIAVATITVLYALRAREYSPHWRNDATLFRESLRVCPRSAKLQLQIAKVHINAGEAEEGRKYIARAKEIDPGFCDIGYQEALVALVGDGNAIKAMELAADNLQCVFTSKGALELLQKIWEQQTEAFPKHPAVWELHGDIAVRAGLAAAAARKYQQACNLAFENQNYQKAIETSKKAIKAVANVTASMELESAELAATYYDLLCNVHVVGGLIRYQIGELMAQQAADRQKAKPKGLGHGKDKTSEKDKDKKKRGKGKQNSEEWWPGVTLETATELLKWDDKKLVREIAPAKSKALLVSTVRAECVMPPGGTNYALLGIHALSGLLTKSFNASSISSVEEYARFTETVVRVTHQSYEPAFRRNSAGAFPMNDVLKVFPFESIANMVQLWTIAAQYYQSRGDREKALASIEHAVQFEIDTVNGNHTVFHDQPEVQVRLVELWSELREWPDAYEKISPVEGSRRERSKLYRTLLKAVKPTIASLMELDLSMNGLIL